MILLALVLLLIPAVANAQCGYDMARVGDDGGCARHADDGTIECWGYFGGDITPPAYAVDDFDYTQELLVVIKDSDGSPAYFHADPGAGFSQDYVQCRELTKGCNGGSRSGLPCAFNDHCPGSTCVFSSNGTCVGGSDAGYPCNIGSPCADPGYCGSLSGQTWRCNSGTNVGDACTPAVEWYDTECPTEFSNAFPSGTGYLDIDAFYHDYHACTISSAGSVSCWGQYDGQMNDSGPICTSQHDWYFETLLYSCAVNADCSLGASTGTCVNDGEPTPAGTFTSMSGAYGAYCGIKSTGAIECWGFDPQSPTPIWTNEPAGTDFVKVEVGDHHAACAMRNDGTLTCWGDDPYDSWAGDLTPPAGSYLDFDIMSGFGCAITSDNGIVCWGDHDSWGYAVPTTCDYVAVYAEEYNMCFGDSAGNIECPWEWWSFPSETCPITPTPCESPAGSMTGIVTFVP